MKIIEWDPSAVERKFSGTFAFTTIEGKAPKWRYIRSVSDSGVVTSHGKRYAARTFQGINGDYPEIEFYYRPINIGWIHSSVGPLNVTRLQNKSYKIGLGTEGYEFDSPEGINASFNDIEIDPDRRIYNFEKDKWCIFSPFFWRLKSSFFFLREDIGFSEGKKLYLNKPSFFPHVKKVLGVEWQINY